MRRVLALALALGACRDFNEAQRECVTNGVCYGGATGGGGATTGGGGTSNGGGGTGLGGGGASGSFAVSANPSSFNVGPGAQLISTIRVTYPGFSFPNVTLSISSDLNAVATFSPNNAVAEQSTMLMNLPFPCPPGSHPLTLDVSVDGGVVASTQLGLTVSSPTTTLLVDDDRSPNNNNATNPMPSPSDVFYAAMLQNTPHDTFISGNADAGPTAAQLSGYDNVLWYTGDDFGAGNIIPRNESDLTAWLNTGNKTLILASENFSSDHCFEFDDGCDDFAQLAGIFGASYLDGVPATLTGTPGTSTAGITVNLDPAVPEADNIDPLNLDAGALPLFTVLADPNSMGMRQVPCASVRKHVGAASSSTFEVIGFGLVSITEPDGGAVTWQALKTAAGFP
jgi:hypothetical protein